MIGLKVAMPISGIFTRKDFISVLLILAVVSVTINSCDENLPPYRDPSDLMEGKIEGQYVLIISDNSVKVFVTIRNVFDETLEGRAPLEGAVEIESLRDPRLRKSVPLRPSNLINARGYNGNLGVLTIDPGDSIRLGYSWNLIADNGTDLRSQFFRFTSDATCPGRLIANEETFILRGELKVFDRLPAVRCGPAPFTFCYVNKWVNPKDCPPILTDRSCEFR
ncbi:MAG: hypothetical protein AABZ61_06680 [Bacteroidota bacterium]